MLGNGNKGCEFNDEIVSYIYNEMDPDGRRRFESHLASCTACTNEFAGISNARFAVFEWHKEEFVSMSTPEIIIPFSEETIRHQEAVEAGMIARWFDLITFARNPFALGGALLVVLVFSLLAVVFFSRSGDVTVATNLKVSPVSVSTVSEDVIAERLSLKESNVVQPPITQSEIEPTKSVVNGSETRSDKTRIKSKPAGNAFASRISNRRPKAPTLSETIDDDDETLRLSDIFDEIGG